MGMEANSSNSSNLDQEKQFLRTREQTPYREALYWYGIAIVVLSYV